MCRKSARRTWPARSSTACRRAPRRCWPTRSRARCMPVCRDRRRFTWRPCSAKRRQSCYHSESVRQNRSSTMQRKSFSNMMCPIARGLERVGEWWSILILRDAFYGLTRFDQFQKSLGIAPNMLTRRLNALVEAELLERRRYSEHPPRDEYILTARGRDFRPVIVALLAWGNKHFAPEGASVLLVDAQTGMAADPILVDRASG